MKPVRGLSPCRNAADPRAAAVGQGVTGKGLSAHERSNTPTTGLGTTAVYAADDNATLISRYTMRSFIHTWCKR